MLRWDQIRQLLTNEIGMPRARELLRAEYGCLAVRLAAALPESNRSAFLDRLLAEQDVSRADIERLLESFDPGSVDPEPTIEAPSPVCVCGHPLSQHSYRSAGMEGDGRIHGMILGCDVTGCACGPGCIHEGFVPR